MQIENLDEFHKWLVVELTPICDADPGALAKYVLALLRKPDKTDEEIKTFSREQLDVFLGQSTVKFVEKMFIALGSKSYISSQQGTSSEVTSEDTTKIKKEKSKSPARENVSTKEETPVKTVRKRISPPPSDKTEDNAGSSSSREKVLSDKDKREKRRSRSPRDKRNRQSSNRGSNNGRALSGDRDRHRRRSRSRSGSRSPNYRRNDRSRRRCKDFEERGYCMRGESCVYYHGTDPVVVDENALCTIVPSIPAPAAANFSLPPPGYNPMNPPPPGVAIVTGEYNPETPALTVTNYSVPPPPLTNAISTATGGNQWQNVQAVQSQGYQPQAPGYMVQQVAPQQIQQQSYRGGSIRGRGGIVRGVGRGGAAATRGMYHGGKDGSTLQVAKIPPELNNIAKLNEHFATFGNIQNIQVRYNGEPDSALITFSSRMEASNAHKSPAPVLNNRFIKVFWHKSDNEENNSIPQTNVAPIAPPAPVEPQKIATHKDSKFVSEASKEHRKVLMEAKDFLAAEKENLAKLVSFQNKQNEHLESLMARQKQFITRARTATDEEEKKTSTKFVKVVHKKIKTVKDEINSTLLQISEKSESVDKAYARVEELKKQVPGMARNGNDENGRKRKADGTEEDDIVGKLSSIIVVKNVEEADVSDLINHMEKFGETFDTSVKVENGVATAVFPFKNGSDARKALDTGKTMNGVVLDMELTNEQLDEIPSTDANMTANQLLASVPGVSIDSDDEEDLLNA